MSLTTAPDLLSIGAFAQRTRLSHKALRLYAELGLLAPAWIDPETGYRFYRSDQVDRARLIGLLRRLDMPLARIGRVLELTGPDAAREIVAFWAEAEVNDDSDGPVELCMPFRGELRSAGDVVVRDEPTHREAFTTITRSQVAFPGILDAYAAAERWIEREGHEMAGAPREVYFVDGDVPPDEPFCDVAFPIR